MYRFVGIGLTFADSAAARVSVANLGPELAPHVVRSNERPSVSHFAHIPENRD